MLQCGFLCNCVVFCMRRATLLQFLSAGQTKIISHVPLFSPLWSLAQLPLILCSQSFERGGNPSSCQCSACPHPTADNPWIQCRAGRRDRPVWTRDCILKTLSIIKAIIKHFTLSSQEIIASKGFLAEFPKGKRHPAEEHASMSQQHLGKKYCKLGFGELQRVATKVRWELNLCWWYINMNLIEVLPCCAEKGVQTRFESLSGRQNPTSDVEDHIIRTMYVYFVWWLVHLTLPTKLRHGNAFSYVFYRL